MTDTDTPIIRKTDAERVASFADDIARAMGVPAEVLRRAGISPPERLALARAAMLTAEQALAAGDISAARMYLADALLHLKLRGS